LFMEAKYSSETDWQPSRKEKERNFGSKEKSLVGYILFASTRNFWASRVFRSRLLSMKVRNKKTDRRVGKSKKTQRLAIADLE
ncbi:MAG: hypothetical protein ACKOFM_03775, partial [Actinomycetota bacterium]